MKNKQGIIYVLIIVVVVAALSFILFYKKGNKVAELKPLIDRKGTLAKSAEFTETKNKADELIKVIKVNPKDVESELQLAKIYLEETRVTGNHAYYDPAALDVIDMALKQDSTKLEAICFKSSILLTQHHFEDGLKEAQKAQRLYPNVAFVYANVEMGDYTKATEVADKMNALRPDLAAYSRVSYLREIFGLQKGAIDAMKLAAEAGIPSEEPSAWCRSILGKLYESIGDTQQAHYQYLKTLSDRPNFPYALAGLGRIEKYNHNYKKAIEYFTQADALIEDFSFTMEIGDIYRFMGDKAKSDEYFNKSLSKLKTVSDDNSNPGHGHYADRELSIVYGLMGDKANALKHALIEYNRRPNNIDVNETLAWAKFLNNESKDANEYIDVALKTKSKNPSLLCKAAIIKSAIGLKDDSKKMIAEAKIGAETWNYDLVEMSKKINE